MKDNLSTRTLRASPVVARIVMASFLAALPGTQAWSQTKGRVGPIGTSTLGLLSPTQGLSAAYSPMNLLPSALPAPRALQVQPQAPSILTKPPANAISGVGSTQDAVTAVASLITAAGQKGADNQKKNPGGSFDGSLPRGSNDDGSQTRAVTVWSPPAEVPVFAGKTIYFPGVNERRLSLDEAGLRDLFPKVMSKGGYLVFTYQDDSKAVSETGVLVRLTHPKSDTVSARTAVMTVIRSVKIAGYTKSSGLEMARVVYPTAEASDKENLDSLANLAQRTLAHYGPLDAQLDNDFFKEALTERNPERLTNLLAQELPLTNGAKLNLLNEPSTEKRLQSVILEMTAHFKQSLSKKPSPASVAPAGDQASVDSLASLAALNARMLAIGMPEGVQKTARAEFDNFARMNPKDSDAQKLRTYLQWLLDVPWSQRTTDTLDLAQARRILNKEHFGLDQVKERILEFLAVRKKTGSMKGAIIALSGPPGTGKTTIASSIALAMGRKFVRLSLGGVHDETVLRGHGRTYQGSMPGKIMDSMKQAGTVNPVMLLDEVDKIGREGNAGDPTAALLEILDPKQNSTFRDQYLNVPYDLSEVIFIVTANELDKIPVWLRDRTEIIEVDGYTTLEKMEIAQRHIVPQQLEEKGLKPEDASLTQAAIRLIIEGYTWEAGVRGLEQNIGKVMREISSWIEMRGEKVPGVVDEGMIAKYLGVRNFTPGQTAQNGVGVATGLYVQGDAGGTMNAEASKEPGTGVLVRRKQFGDAIDDSSITAYAHVKQNAAKYGLEKFDFKKIDVDINMTPATKIDGPSAGTLMVTAIISALTGRPVTPGLAMTGEMSKRGDILPIGGLKQKVLAAHRMGYTEVIFPFANLKDIEDIPKEVRDAIKLTPVKTYDEIFAAAFVP